MIRVEYPIQICPNYEDLYKELFHAKIEEMQNHWDALRQSNVSLQIFPVALEDILLADYSTLVWIYNSYGGILPYLSNQIQEDLKRSVFNYELWSSDIADYFIDPSHGFKFSTCHYCDTAYINAYEINVEKDALFFLNTASNKELSSKLNTRSTKSITAYRNARPYTALTDFNKVASRLGCAPNKYERTFKLHKNMKRHFDVEHVLPKSECPLVGLSLYNFVPSCQVCNSKMKQTRVLGYFGVPMDKLSPTSRRYDFDEKVKFRLIPQIGSNLSCHPTKNPNSYVLELDASLDSDYDYNVQLFRLNERYNYHKMEALHWLELKYLYTDAHLAMMANALHDSRFSAKSIKEDIFQTRLDNDHHRVFGKLKKDILE